MFNRYSPLPSLITPRLAGPSSHVLRALIHSTTKKGPHLSSWRKSPMGQQPSNSSWYGMDCDVLGTPPPPLGSCTSPASVRGASSLQSFVVMLLTKNRRREQPFPCCWDELLDCCENASNLLRKLSLSAPLRKVGFACHTDRLSVLTPMVRKNWKSHAEKLPNLSWSEKSDFYNADASVRSRTLGFRALAYDGILYSSLTVLMMHFFTR